VIRDVFGGKAKAQISFAKKDLAYIVEMFPSIQEIK
jgi:hypothetical protein